MRCSDSFGIGICAAEGEGCTEQFCLPEEETEPEKCGPNTCEKGEVCCNESCGMKTPNCP